MRDYLLNSNVQLGATYPASQRATKRVDHGADATAVIFNAGSRDEVAFGHSSTQLLANLAKAVAAKLDDKAEIVLTGEHEGEIRSHTSFWRFPSLFSIPSERGSVEESR